MSVDLNMDVFRAMGNSPRVHPNGFIQLDISKDKARSRLHVWHRGAIDFGQNSDSPVHDHIFDMQSRIYRGSLTQIRYEFELRHAGEPTHEIFMADYLGKSESVLQPTGVKGCLEYDHNRSILVTDGEYYYQPAFTFHDTQPGKTPLVTIMTKSYVYERFSPRVLVPIDESPDNDFRRDQYKTDELWDIIEDAIS